MVQIAVLSKTHKDFNRFIESLPGYIKCSDIEFINIIRYEVLDNISHIDYYMKLETKPTNNTYIKEYLEKNNIPEIENIKKLTEVF